MALRLRCRPAAAPALCPWPWPHRFCAALLRCPAEPSGGALQLDSARGNPPHAPSPQSAPLQSLKQRAAAGVSLAASLALPQAAFAAQEVAQLADNRPLILLGLGLPVIGWVLFNIAQPALRQLDSMQEEDSKPVKGKKR